MALPCRSRPLLRSVQWFAVPRPQDSYYFRSFQVTVSLPTIAVTELSWRVTHGLYLPPDATEGCWLQGPFKFGQTHTLRPGPLKGLMLKLKLQYFGHLMRRKSPSCWKRLKTGGEGDDGDEMVRRLHQLNGHEFEQALGVGDEQGSLVCCSPWGRIWLSDWTELNKRLICLIRDW